METALRFEGVKKRFGKCRALDGLDLSVPRGSAFGLVGSNGAGKTTSFAVAVGLERCNGGTIDLLGAGPFNSAVHSGRVSVMPQDTQFQPYARLTEILTLYAHLQGIRGPEVNREVAEMLEWVHLSDRAHAQIRTLSHGMRRRVVIAQAFLGRPELVLLDEPMSGLDPREVVNVRNLLCNRPGHQTVVISSHNLHELERICDHVAFIEKGKLIRQERMDNVTGRSHSITYRLGSTSGLDNEAMGRALSGLSFEIVDGENLLCRYVEGEFSAPAVNDRVLSYLLAQKAEIHEIRKGSDLESIYIAGSGGN